MPVTQKNANPATAIVSRGRRSAPTVITTTLLTLISASALAQRSSSPRLETGITLDQGSAPPTRDRGLPAARGESSNVLGVPSCVKCDQLYASGCAGELYVIDPATLTSKRIDQPVNPMPEAMYDVGFSPDGRLWGIGEQWQQKLYEIDPDDAQTRVAGTLSGLVQWTGLAGRTVTPRIDDVSLFAGGAGYSPVLQRIDVCGLPTYPITGVGGAACWQSGDWCQGVSGDLAFRPSDQELFGTLASDPTCPGCTCPNNGDMLVRIDQGTGAILERHCLTNGSGPSAPGLPAVLGIAFDSQDVLWGVQALPTPNAKILQIDPTTGAAIEFSLVDNPPAFTCGYGLASIPCPSCQDDVKPPKINSISIVQKQHPNPPNPLHPDLCATFAIGGIVTLTPIFDISVDVSDDCSPPADIQCDVELRQMPDLFPADNPTWTCKEHPLETAGVDNTRCRILLDKDPNLGVYTVAAYNDCFINVPDCNAPTPFKDPWPHLNRADCAFAHEAQTQPGGNFGVFFDSIEGPWLGVHVTCRDRRGNSSVDRVPFPPRDPAQFCNGI